MLEFIRKYLSDLLLVVLLLVVIALLQIFSNLEVTITFVLLVVVWMFHIQVKRGHQLGTETMYADLSFSAVAFCAGQGISLIKAASSGSLDVTRVLQLVVIGGGLLLLWQENLRICINIAGDQSTTSKIGDKEKFAIRCVSFVLAAISTAGVLVPQMIGII